MPNYRTQDPYERIPINQLARINQEDPWFGLGYLLAQGYNRAYDQRGVDKSVQELQNSLGPTQAERDNSQDAVLSQLPTIEGDYNQLNKYADEVLKNGAGYNANPAAQALPEAPANGLYSAGNAANFAGQPAYNFGVGDARAYQTDNRAAINALAGAQAADRLRNFDINQWQANETAKLISQGRTPEQIDAAMAAMLPQAQALEQRNKDLDTMEAVRMLSGMDLTSGFNPNAWAVASRLTKSNPELARMVFKSFIDPRDEYSAKINSAQQDKRLDNAIQFAKEKAYIASVYGGYGTGGRSGSNNKSVFDSSEYKAAVNMRNDITKKYENNLDGTAQMTPEDKQALDRANAIIASAWDSYFLPQQPAAGGSSSGLNVNDYNSVGNYVRSIAEYAQQNGISNDEVAAALRQEMPGNPYLNDHLINYGLVKG